VPPVGLRIPARRQPLIARDLRLRDSRDFDRVRKTGRSWSARLLVLAVLPNDRGTNRYGFATGKRIGGAVQRNRAKRLMREAVRARHAHLSQGYDVLLIARNTFDMDTTFSEVAEQMDVLLRKAGLEAAPAP
jgi:ribonuclease P protein component